MAVHRSQRRKLVGYGVQRAPGNSKGDLVHGVEISEIFAPFVHLRAEVAKHFGHQKARFLSPPSILIRLIYPLFLLFSFPPNIK